MRIGPLVAVTVLLAWPVSAELLDPQNFIPLGVFDTTAGGNFTIDTDALTITDDSAPATPLFSGVIDDQGGLADSFGPGAAVTTVGAAGIPHIAVFAFSDLQLGAASNFTIVGHRALALLSLGNATIDVVLRLNGEPGFQISGIAPPSPPDYAQPRFRGGPGGFAGAVSAGWGMLPGPGEGPGGAGSTKMPDPSGLGGSSRGAGGSHGNVGRIGVCNLGLPGATCIIGAPGSATVDPLAAILRGGSGGGAAHHSFPMWLDSAVATGEVTASGLGGGGAIEIGATGLLTLGTASIIDASALLQPNQSFASAITNPAISGWGSGGGVRLHGGRLINLGSGNVSARASHDAVPSKGEAGGTILMRGIDSAFVVGQGTLSASQFGAKPGNGIFALSISRVLVLAGESFALSDATVVQTQTTTLPRIDLSVENVEIQDTGTGTVPTGGFTNRYEIRLSGPLAQLAGTDLLTNEGVLRGSGSIAAPVTNAAGGRVDVSSEALDFMLGLRNEVGANVSVVAGTLTVPGDGLSNDDGLVNLGQLNLIEAIVDGDVRSPAGSQINVAGTVHFNGLVSGAGTFSGTQNLITFNGGYSPGDSPAQIAFGGDVRFDALGDLTLELGGAIAGAEHDRLDVSGQLDLAGTLDLLPIGGFVPPLGTSFTLLTYASRVGEFDDIVGVQQPGELDLAIAYETGTVVASTRKRGDVDGDGLLTAADTAIVQAGAAAGLITTAYGSGDVDGNGIVDAADVTVVENAVGATPVPALNPSMIGLLVLVVCAAGCRRL